jgi:hypothetical protein
VAVQDAQFFAYLFEHPAEESTTSFPQSAVISLLNHFSQSLDCTRVPNQHKLIYTKLPSVLRVGHPNSSKRLTESEAPWQGNVRMFQLQQLTRPQHAENPYLQQGGKNSPSFLFQHRFIHRRVSSGQAYHQKPQGNR